MTRGQGAVASPSKASLLSTTTETLGMYSQGSRVLPCFSLRFREPGFLSKSQPQGTSERNSPQGLAFQEWTGGGVCVQRSPGPQEFGPLISDDTILSWISSL